MFKDKFLVWVFLITALIIGGGVYFSNRSTRVESIKVESESDAKAVIDKTFYDWGEIGIKSGLAEAKFNIKNEGTTELRLYDIVTSCACTKARLKVGDTISPEFGMHTKSKYVMGVPVGEVAELTVVFDPAFHGPQGVGKIDRIIKVKTNDPNKPEITFNLSALVTK